MTLDARRILYEDDTLLIVHKLPRELVVRGKGKLQRLPLLDFLKKTRPHLQAIHRLDYETSGIVAFAKKPAVLESIIARNFAGWKKYYEAIVIGHVPHKGEISLKLPARVGNEKVDALSKYRVITHYPGFSHVEVEISSGRHHQIRRHFSMIGHPLICDDIYGDAKENRRFSKTFKLRDFFLHASKLVLPHPETGAMIEITDPLPPTFTLVLKKLKR